MLNFLIHQSLKNRLLVLTVALVVLAVGIYQSQKLPVEVLPDLTKPRVTLMTEAPGNSPEEVEKYVTLPLEQAVNGIQGVTRIQSTSDIGLSLVFVEFEWGTDIYQARQFVQERLRTVDLQADVTPYMTPVASLMGEVMLIGVTSPNETVSPEDLRTFTDWTLRRQILKIPGVAESLSMGGGIKQVQIKPIPEKMLAYGISSEDINSAASEAASNATGGYITKRSQEQMIRLLAMTTDLEQIKKTVVEKRGDRIITLADVAEVTWGIQPQRGEAGVNGNPGVVLSIVKSPGVDTRTLTKQIEQTMAEMSLKLEEEQRDIILTPLFRQANFIDAAMHNLLEAIRDGAIMVIIVLFIFLFSLRSPLSSITTTLITLTAIPLSFAVTVIIFTLFGISVNSMTLGGLAVAIGIVVDDAIVDVENVLRRLKINQGQPKPKSRIHVIAAASREVRNSILYATIFIILVFVPLLALSGVEGRLFTPIAIATITSMAASFVVSLTVIPVLCSLLLHPKKNTEHKDGILIAFLKKLLAWFQKMPKEFLPQFKEETLIVAMTTAPGTSLETTHQLALIVDKQLYAIEGVKTVGHRAGRAERGDHVVPVSTVEFDIELEEQTSRSRNEIEEEIRSTMQDVPGVFSVISGPLTDRISHMLSGVPAKVAIKVSGSDLEKNREIGKGIQKICKDIPGLEEAKLGITAKSFNKQLSSMLDGELLYELNEKERVIDLVSRLDDNIRQSHSLTNYNTVSTKNSLNPLNTVFLSKENI